MFYFTKSPICTRRVHLVYFAGGFFAQILELEVMLQFMLTAGIKWPDISTWNGDRSKSCSRVRLLRAKNTTAGLALAFLRQDFSGSTPAHSYPPISLAYAYFVTLSVSISPNFSFRAK